MSSRFLKVLCVASFAMAGGLVSGANAATYNLTTDYSATNNPNGAWSYTYDGGNLPHQAAALDNGNPHKPAIPGGYFAPGNDLWTNTPMVWKAAVDGSSGGGNDGDFLAGDIVVHSSNEGGPLKIIWTAPSAGTVSNFLAKIWYAHSSVDRSNDVKLYLNDVQQGATFTTSDSSNPNRPHAGQITLLPFAVLAGDAIILEFLKTSGQPYGSLTGVYESFTFDAASPVPLPAALPLFATVLAGAGLIAARRKRRAKAIAA